ncbi:MAG: hypothetical protein PHE06_02080 [Lachnospiraceae bacterium]|nr:hypothetical protein [Lachnospiraceae bacterium]
MSNEMKHWKNKGTSAVVKILFAAFICFVVYAGYCLISGERVVVSLAGELFILAVTAILYFAEKLWKKKKE